MLKKILGGVVGYVATFVCMFIAFSCVYLAMGADRAFTAGTFQVSTLWIVISLAILVLGIFPQLLQAMTSLFGVVLPANLLFALAILLLLGVALHLSWELSQAEEENRRTAEEMAVLRADHDELSQRKPRLQADASRGPDVGVPTDE